MGWSGMGSAAGLGEVGRGLRPFPHSPCTSTSSHMDPLPSLPPLLSSLPLSHSSPCFPPSPSPSSFPIPASPPCPSPFSHSFLPFLHFFTFLPISLHSLLLLPYPLLPIPLSLLHLAFLLLLSLQLPPLISFLFALVSFPLFSFHFPLLLPLSLPLPPLLPLSLHPLPITFFPSFLFPFSPSSSPSSPPVLSLPQGGSRRGDSALPSQPSANLGAGTRGASCV